MAVTTLVALVALLIGVALGGFLSTRLRRDSGALLLATAEGRFDTAAAPLTDALHRLESRLREVETDRARTEARLAQQIQYVGTGADALRRETAALVDALRKPQARGRWGELQLRRCVELGGMAAHCDVSEQVTVAGEAGAQRPDLVVHLTGGRCVVVDSKVTLAAYLEAHEATDPLVQEERLAAHARYLRQHVDALAAKAYWNALPATPEFVVLFVPGDAFLAPALERDPALLDDAFARRVHIATPTTLISLLRTLAYAWQTDALAANAREVVDTARTLHQRLGAFGAHLDKLGRQITGVTTAYNAAVGSIERSVLPSARKLADYGVVVDDLATPLPVTEPVRPLAAAELLESA